MHTPPGHPHVFTLFLVVFLDLVGFGMIIPVFPFYAERIGVSPSSVIFFLGLYSAGQLVGAPLWGSLSDRIGRRPVLLFTLLANAASTWMLAYADTGVTLALSRVLAGLAAGNISTAYAYTTDITTDATRPKALGLLGSAFGMGFILGPALGGLLAGTDGENGSSLVQVAHAAAVLSLVAFVLTFLRLPESLPPEKRRQANTKRTSMKVFFSRPVLRGLLVATIVVVAAVSLLQSTLALFSAERLAVGPRTLGWIYGFTGVISVAVQVGGIGKLTARFGARQLAMVGIVLTAIGMAGVPFAHGMGFLLATLSVFAVGSALFNPSMSGLVAASADPHERGGVLGAYQGAASLGRVIGPVVGSGVASVVGLSGPFAVGAAVCLVGTLLLSQKRR
ncbi:MFS transporter [Gemmatimonas phototrophica]|uniref:MFS transporter n=1 Tax=Gemmatimonas phototrophica TaxID=1379270 RepID=UPI0013141747|nr:MFS transporter [Gemmatimonas phototrophica]